ncbi:MAG TPA: HIT family protein [Halomonas sp.]|nr:HIT family protein [Halomonas sp.]
MPDFQPDARLAADSHALAELPLCQVRLMNDSRFPWLVLLPRRPGVSEVFDLEEDEQQQLWREATAVGRTLKDSFNGDKLNIATLGNMVAQLHVHVIVRHRGDAAWPAPVWGHGQPEAYRPEALQDLQARLLAQLDTLPLATPHPPKG